MPSMSKLRFAAVFALAVGGAVSWTSSEQDALKALATEDACVADGEACGLTLRQLRGEQVAAAVEQHEFSRPKDEEDEDDDDEGDDEHAAPKKVAAGRKGKLAKKAGQGEGDAEDDEDEDEDDDKDAEEDEDAEEEDEDFYGDEDDEEAKRGEFCCQHGQGMGAADDSDEGATCYPSSKPEVYDFCDNQDICRSDCNGTWVVGFCALDTIEGEDACGLELNEEETGYDYTGSKSRGVMEDPCAASATACSGCNGTWCQYFKTPMY